MYPKKAQGFAFQQVLTIQQELIVHVHVHVDEHVHDPHIIPSGVIPKPGPLGQVFYSGSLCAILMTEDNFSLLT